MGANMRCDGADLNLAVYIKGANYKASSFHTK